MTSEPSETFNRVRQMRSSRGWSQAELARRAGVSRAAVSAIEIHRLIPSVAAALKLAACFDCTVEELFSPRTTSAAVEWAWQSSTAAGRYWRAEVAGRLFTYPVEETAAGHLPHDGCVIENQDSYHPDANPSRTLMVACCDPAAGLLASEYARQTGLRMIVLGRSSGAALELLAQGHAHVAGVHLAESGGRRGNSAEVESAIGRPAVLLRLARWEEGIALAPGSRATSLRNAVRLPMQQWVGRDAGSGARQCQDELLGAKRQPMRTAPNHRGVAHAVRFGWAEAGVCIRLVSQESGLNFLPVRFENLDLAYLKSSENDPRVEALIRVVRSAAYRRLLGELPGYEVSDTGELEWTASR